MRMANIVKLNGVRPEVIKLQLFPFSLRDVAATWFESLPIGSVNNWEELVWRLTWADSSLLPSLLKGKGEILVFKQREDKSLYNA